MDEEQCPVCRQPVLEPELTQPAHIDNSGNWRFPCPRCGSPLVWLDRQHRLEKAEDEPEPEAPIYEQLRRLDDYDWFHDRLAGRDW